MKPKKIAVFYQTAGKTQLPKRLIVGKDRAAGKVLAGKSVHSAFLWFVGSKGENASPQPFMKKAGYRFPEKVAVPSFSGVVWTAFLPCKRSLMLRGYSGTVAVCSAALWAFCSKRARTAARSKSSPSLRAVMGFVLSGVR